MMPLPQPVALLMLMLLMLLTMMMAARTAGEEGDQEVVARRLELEAAALRGLAAVEAERIVKR